MADRLKPELHAPEIVRVRSDRDLEQEQTEETETARRDKVGRQSKSTKLVWFVKGPDISIRFYSLLFGFRQRLPTKMGDEVFEGTPPPIFVQNVHFCDFAKVFHDLVFRNVHFCFNSVHFCSLLFSFVHFSSLLYSGTETFLPSNFIFHSLLFAFIRFCAW
jgi:hypothetical protein